MTDSKCIRPVNTGEKKVCNSTPCFTKNMLKSTNKLSECIFTFFTSPRHFNFIFGKDKTTIFWNIFFVM